MYISMNHVRRKFVLIISALLGLLIFRSFQLGYQIRDTTIPIAASSDSFPSMFDDSETLHPLDVDDSEAWCKHLSSTTEPPLVLYNRIPKAGGTTMQKIYWDKPRWRLTSEYWGNIDRENLKDKLQSKFSSILEKSYEGTTTIVDGHFKPMFPVHNAVYMNLMRLPKSRLVSHFYYALYDSKEAIKSGNGTNIKMIERINSPYLDEKCLTSANCTNYLKSNCKIQLQHLCTGGSCGKTNRDGRIDNNDIGEILSNKLLEVLGFQEEFEKSLDMFECAFPSIFEGGKEKLKKMGAQKVGNHKFGIISKELEKLMDETFCVDEMELYKRALEQFNYRYNKMVLNRGSCCRVKNK